MVPLLFAKCRLFKSSNQLCCTHVTKCSSISAGQDVWSDMQHCHESADSLWHYLDTIYRYNFRASNTVGRWLRKCGILSNHQICSATLMSQSTVEGWRFWTRQSVHTVFDLSSDNVDAYFLADPETPSVALRSAYTVTGWTFQEGQDVRFWRNK